MIQLELSSLAKQSLDNETMKIRAWFDRLKHDSPCYFEAVKILGPFSPSIEKLRNRYRKQILLYSKNYKPIHQLVSMFSKNYKNIPSHLPNIPQKPPQPKTSPPNLPRGRFGELFQITPKGAHSQS